MQTFPGTSVIVTCYKYGHLLDEAVDSVMRQTVGPREILIMDDASPDNTPEVGQRWAREAVVRYSRNETNLGTPRNIDVGVRLSCAEYLLHLDADNRLRPTFIEEAQAMMTEKVGVVYTDAAVFGPIAKGISKNSTWWRNRREEDGFLIWEFFDFNRDLLRRRNYIHGGSLFRRACWDQVGGYEACIHPNRAEDYSLWYQICLEKGWDAAYLKKPLLEYRMHSAEQRSIKQPRRP